MSIPAAYGGVKEVKRDAEGQADRRDRLVLSAYLPRANITLERTYLPPNAEDFL